MGTLAANVAAFALLGMIPAPNLFPAKPPAASSSVRVAVGLNQPEDNINLGGAKPGIALFNENGDRIGVSDFTNTGDNIGTGDTVDITVPSIDPKNDNIATYMTISADDTNEMGQTNPSDICVAYITVTAADGGATQVGATGYRVLGETGKLCDQDWYHSNLPVQSQDGNTNKPACFWLRKSMLTHAPTPLSGIGGVALRAVEEISLSAIEGKDTGAGGMAIHLLDFMDGMTDSMDEGRQTDYMNNPNTMCNSTPRFTHYPHLTRWNYIPVFDPPLNYTQDGRDPVLPDGSPDLNAILQPGKVSSDAGQYQPNTLLDPQERWDAGNAAFNRHDTSSEQPDADAITSSGERRRRRSARLRRRNPFESHVVVSDHERHSARELCQHPRSRGPDFFSKRENLHCDMERRTLTPGCTTDDDTNCFDANQNIVRSEHGLSERGEDGATLAVKAYSKRSDWT